ncbi:MAG: HlyD family efflux transporter periplasmic adaptor subunit [Gudongella sp.]|nr:HlyD family efflux transporter periplasmic adaptor subunit [Gudongella sp.]
MKKSNNLGLTKVILSVILVLFILLVINYIPKILKREVSTILPIYFEYKETLPIQGVTIKDEKLYFSETDGEIYGIIDEGLRVPVGMEIAEILSPKDMTFYKGELDSIESLINQLSINTSSTTNNASSTVQMTNTLIKQIQTDIQSETYTSLKKTKENLSFAFKNHIQTQETNNSDILSSEKLVEKRSKLLQEISNYNERLFSKHSGIVSYKIDSYEEMLTSNDLDSSADHIFDSDISIKLSSNQASKVAFKIIDGYDYYIALKLSKYNSLLLKDKDKLEIEVEIDELDEHNINFVLPVVKRYSRGTEEIVLLKSNQFLEIVYNHRLLDLNIVIVKKDSYKIPLESVITINNQQGVFVRSFYDVVVFRPIILNAKDEKFAYIDIGDTDNRIEIKDKSYKTINEFSEIIKSPNLVEDGQILN